MFGSAWADRIPLLSHAHRVHAPTALVRGGFPRTDPERVLGDLGLDRPHLAGNSMGGWMSILASTSNRSTTRRTVLTGVGHIPLIDDPALVADIISTTGAAGSR